MKRVVSKTIKKVAKKETELELLARLVKDGFERMEKKFEQTDMRFDNLERRVSSGFEKVDSQLFSINHELKDHTVRLDSIERKQGGIRISLDETVHASEFKALSKRVEVLEKGKSK